MTNFRHTALTLIGSSLFVQLALGQNITQQQPFKGVIGKSSADSKESWTLPVKAPAGAPNVVWKEPGSIRRSLKN